MKNIPPRVRALIKRPIPLTFVVLGASATLLLINLTDLITLFDSEKPSAVGSLNKQMVADSILFAPVKLLQLIILKVDDNDSLVRLASVVTAALTAVFMYILLKKWHTARVALITSAMFISSSMFLHSGRSAHPEVMFLSVLPVLFVLSLWFLSKLHTAKLPIIAALLAVLLYVPGTWLFIVAGLTVFRRMLKKSFSQISKKVQAISTGIFLIGISPLIYGFTQNKGEIIHWLGVDTSQSLAPTDFLQRIVSIPDALFYSGLEDPSRWLLGTPILDVFTAAMMILGIFAYRAGYYPAREKLVFGAALIALILIIFGQAASIALLIPIIYILVANGIAYLLQSWFTVFPRNPVARTLGVSLLCVAVAISCAFQAHRYYQAWPQAETTQQALKTDR